jgi:DNA-binding MarR family transcriptional regulator
MAEMNATPTPTSRGAERSCAEAMDGDLGWALGMVFRRYVKAAKQAAADLPGGPRGYQVLRSAAGDTPSTQLAIAEQLGVDRTVMTYLLDDLEADGLIERLADPSDRRVRRIAATAKGRARLAELGERLDEAERASLAGLDEGEQITLRRLVNRLAWVAAVGEPPGFACDQLAELERAETGTDSGGIPGRRTRRPARRG